MTQTEADEEAVRRWGEHGWTRGGPNENPRHVVGVRVPADRGPCAPPWDETEYGRGDTWEAAFEDATERGH